MILCIRPTNGWRVKGTLSIIVHANGGVWLRDRPCMEPLKKKLFQIGLVDYTRVEPLKQVLQYWAYGSYTRGRCSTCGSSLRGALKTGRRSRPPPPFLWCCSPIKLVSVLLCAAAERVAVTCMRDFSRSLLSQNYSQSKVVDKKSKTDEKLQKFWLILRIRVMGFCTSKCLGFKAI